MRTPELAAHICAQIAAGRSLVAILRDDEDMPSYTMVTEWLREDDAFAAMYTRAREDQADYLADEIVSIADRATGNEDANARRLQVDARKWVAAKLRPRKYGDHQRVEHASDEEHPVQVVIHHVGSKPPES